jgi:hypothetical protein
MPPGYEEESGVYMLNTGTIHLNLDVLAEENVEDAINIAIHEGLHAAIHQAGWEIEEEAEEEWETASLFSRVGKDLYEGCQSPTESGAPSGMPPYPWVSGFIHVGAVVSWLLLALVPALAGGVEVLGLAVIASGVPTIRKALSFSKKTENNIGALWYFVHHYNARICRAQAVRLSLAF